jgi:hypothetical protein
MSFSNAAETAIMSLIFNATAWANMADNAGTSPQVDIAVALATGDPGEGGSMSTSEVTYTSYARVDVDRASGGSGWTVTAGSVSPSANIDFPAGTGGSGTVTHFSAGKTGGGASAIHMSGTVTPNIVTGNGVTPRLTTSTTLTID